MEKVTCPKCSTEIETIDYGGKQMGVCENCDYLYRGDKADEITDGALLEDMVKGFNYKRDPDEFDDWPSNQQTESFKRGG